VSRYDVTVEHNVAATMRDGTVLRADVYRPTASGPWPVLLTRLPYGKHLPGLIRMTIDPLGMARGGYIVVVQDTRGCFASEGDWEPWTFEADDGYDSVRSLTDIHNGWFGQHLVADSAADETDSAQPALPPVLLFVMGTNEWRDPAGIRVTSRPSLRPRTFLTGRRPRGGIRTTRLRRCRRTHRTHRVGQSDGGPTGGFPVPARECASPVVTAWRLNTAAGRLCSSSQKTLVLP
jgi:hypothetical protein